ncbi:DUF3152 domain-containing protein [Streptomyces hoynatensis]|uniref:DUF3152 domain-containing protein n=1 Tax=Streptomyces hoynatensis TaxID=1141874 RepID=A0A3A9ZEF0_9ACTN|nr:DUF3152 domain-containing protein [Streptomyces hoynatensis]RKN45656.1 DUF3152 domain-containing protein [Streptomyces hoynatensis]
MPSGKKRKNAPPASAARGRRGGSRRAVPSRRRGRPRRRRGTVLVVACLACVACLAVTAFVHLRGGGTDAAEARPEPSAGPGGSAAPEPEDGQRDAEGGGAGDGADAGGGEPDEALEAGDAASSAAGSGSGETTGDPGPTSGTGEFVTADASGEAVGGGATVRRYMVQVEVGTGVDPEEAAAEIEGILADPRGWTADGVDAFQLVSEGSYDFEIKIATPDTVDRICGAAGLHTHGEVNCDVGDQVVVNLRRWNTGSPQFPGPLHEYRALIVNHEVGHRIGHGHEGCPGPGLPAPAMMQQIDGLDGCVANAWPYDADGNYLSGPSVP